MSSGQAVRPSQFVLTYGVGSILEAPNGPRMILDFKYWGRIFGRPSTCLELSTKYQIRDDNVSALLNGGKIFRLPSNAELQLPDEQVLFKTDPFPHWALCQDHRILYEIAASGSTRCPHCRIGKMAQHEAIRFVRACPRGHLDDVDWKGIVHRRNPTCDGALFDWIETGSTLYDIAIECRKCGAKATLRDIYNGTWGCSGYFPESRTSEMCSERASIILRNASNLRVSEIVSALTIPPRTSQLHRLLEDPQILPIIASEGSWTKDKLISKLKNASRVIPSINPALIVEVERKDENDIISAINEVSEPPKKNLTSKEVKEKELQALQDAAVNGAPPRPYSEPQDFEVDKRAVMSCQLSKNLLLRITPVKRLRVVMAQKGYRRLVRGPTPITVPACYRDNNDSWYAGVEVRGEGIFVDLAPQQELHLGETEAGSIWTVEFDKNKNYLFHPTFIWWHTLSHRLINALAIDSGYSAASIRERVYFSVLEGGNRHVGGVLLYTSQQGGEGSLGGLIALVSEFNNVISAAIRNVDSCSNDPLCSEQRPTSSRVSGAACYACLLISETSCEYSNAYLDRNLLSESIS